MITTYPITAKDYADIESSALTPEYQIDSKRSPKCPLPEMDSTI